MLLRHMTGPTTNPFTALTQRLCSSYAIDDQHEVSRSNCVRRTRSRTPILVGNTLLHPDYRAAACSGFAASAALAPPRSARLGTTIPLGRPVSRRLTTTPNPQMDHSPPAASAILLYNTTNNDNSAAAEPLSNTLLGYSLRDQDRAQRAGPLCDATQRHIQLGCPNPPILVLCGRLSSHTRSEITIIANLTAKGRLLQGCMTPSYLSGNILPPTRRLTAATATGVGSPLMVSSAFMCHFWPDRGSCTDATPMLLATSVSQAHSKCWNAYIGKWI